ncbi:MAG: hypothetical protein LBH72_06720 [Proteiniphilum sp.]|nr:hypothetical protein [Proteiniphilum sp.]
MPENLTPVTVTGPAKHTEIARTRHTRNEAGKAPGKLKPVKRNRIITPFIPLFAQLTSDTPGDGQIRTDRIRPSMPAKRMNG